MFPRVLRIGQRQLRVPTLMCECMSGRLCVCSQGMNFLEYSNIAAGHVRNALKEPARSAAQNRGIVHFRERLWTGGVGT